MHTFYLVLEYAYYASGVALAIIAWVGLRQLTIAKETARTNAKREAFKLAADQCDYYLNRIIPLQNGLNALIDVKKLAIFEKSTVEIRDETVKLRSAAVKEDLKALLDDEFVQHAAETYNAMEAFALFFVSGVAAEKVAFSAVGQTFCHSLRRYLPHLVLCGGGKQHYRNMFRLFFLWNNRIEAQKLAEQREQVERQLEKVKDRFIDPIGTEDI